MEEHPDHSLLNALNFIHLHMVELATDCGNTVQGGIVTLQYVLQLQDRLEKILQETRAACSPPQRQPVMADFETIKCLGSGSYGTVNLVCHKETGLNLAMKMIAREKVTEETKADVLMERDILAFTDNPSVVSLFCTFETEGHFCMAMEYAGGGDCEGLLKKNKRLSVDLARQYVAETTLAVEYIHRYGIIHADLKPPNLLIGSNGHIKLADFGVSKIGPVNMTVDKKDLKEKAIEVYGSYMFGTPRYMAPEMIEGSYGKPVDWWSLGIVLYEFLVGKVPFDGNTDEEVLDEVYSRNIDWSKVDPPLPTDAQDIIDLLLTKDYESRLGTAGGAGEVKAHPFFHGLDWDNLLNQDVPQLEEEENTTQSISEHLPRDESSASPSGSSKHEEKSVDIPDFCRVAYRFKEAYGSQEHLTLSNLRSAIPGNQVEEEQWEDKEQGWEDQEQSLEDQEQSWENQEQGWEDQEQGLEDQEQGWEDQGQSLEDQKQSLEDQKQSWEDQEQSWEDQEQSLEDQGQSLEDQKQSWEDQEQGWEDQEQGWEEEAHPTFQSTDSDSILSQEAPQLEDEEETAQSNTDDGPVDQKTHKNGCSDGSSDEDSAGHDSSSMVVLQISLQVITQPITMAILMGTSLLTCPPVVVVPPMRTSFLTRPPVMVAPQMKTPSAETRPSMMGLLKRTALAITHRWMCMRV